MYKECIKKYAKSVVNLQKFTNCTVCTVFSISFPYFTCFAFTGLHYYNNLSIVLLRYFLQSICDITASSSVILLRSKTVISANQAKILAKPRSWRKDNCGTLVSLSVNCLVKKEEENLLSGVSMTAKTGNVGLEEKF